MSAERYKDALHAAFRLLAGVSTANQQLNTQILAHAGRLEGIKADRSLREAVIFETVNREAATDLIRYSNELEDAIKGFEINIPLIAEGFSNQVNGLDLEKEKDKAELGDYIREFKKFVNTVSDNKEKVAVMRNQFMAMRDTDYESQLTQAAITVLRTVDRLFAAFEEFETFGLKVLFDAEGRL